MVDKDKPDKKNRIEEIKKVDGGYKVSVEKDTKKYVIFLTDKELTDFELSKELIRNKINMMKKHEENITKLIDMEI